jgi:hypothetical protein
LDLYLIVSALAGTMVAVLALTFAAALRVGARSEESLGVPITQDNLWRDGRSSRY